MINIITIDNREIEVYKRGEGKQVVVIHTGMGGTIYEWSDLIEKIALDFTVIAYHRQGYGKSKLTEHYGTTEQTILDTLLILDYFDITKPIILVGHSYGGLCVQHFIKKFPNKVKGAVLVDSTPMDINQVHSIHTPKLDEFEIEMLDQCKKYANMTSTNLRSEMTGLLLKIEESKSNFKEETKAFRTSPFFYQAMVREMQNWLECAKVIKNEGSFPNIPLFVLGRDETYSIKLQTESEKFPKKEIELVESLWQRLIVEQAKLSPQGEYIKASNASHSIFVDRPDLVIYSIYKFIN